MLSSALWFLKLTIVTGGWLVFAGGQNYLTWPGTNVIKLSSSLLNEEDKITLKASHIAWCPAFDETLVRVSITSVKGLLYCCWPLWQTWNHFSEVLYLINLIFFCSWWQSTSWHSYNFNKIYNSQSGSINSNR